MITRRDRRTFLEYVINDFNVAVSPFLQRKCRRRKYASFTNKEIAIMVRRVGFYTRTTDRVILITSITTITNRKLIVSFCIRIFVFDVRKSRVFV